MAIPAFEPRALARAIEIRHRPYLWYAAMYYRPAEGVHGTRLVDIDVRVQGKTMAPIQRPSEASKMIGRDGFEQRSIRLPYMKPAMPTTAEEILQRREPGSHLYSERDLVGAAQRQIGRDIMDLDDMVERRKEYMAAQGAVTGVTPLISLLDAGVPSIQAEVDWGMPEAHLITLTSTDLWTHAESDPIGNLRTWCNLAIQAAGVSPDIATLGTEVANALLKHADVLKLLDNRRIEAGQLELRAQGVEGITYLGRLKGVDLYEDARTYTDDSGSAAYYTPADRVVLGSRNAENRWHYGPISDLKCPTPRVERWVKTWEKEEPSVRYVAVHSSPLPALHQPDSIVSVKAV